MLSCLSSHIAPSDLLTSVLCYLKNSMTLISSTVWIQIQQMVTLLVQDESDQCQSVSCQSADCAVEDSTVRQAVLQG